MIYGYARHGLGTCPKCGCPAQRVPRRLIDRLLSRFTPVERYRCLSPACVWEGNLREAASGGVAAASSQ